MLERKILELRARIAKMEHDLYHARVYRSKLEHDRNNILQALRYNFENLEYLRSHVGVIDVAQLKVLKMNLANLNSLLLKANMTITDFCNGMLSQERYLDQFIGELHALELQETNKVVDFTDWKTKCQKKN